LFWGRVHQKNISNRCCQAVINSSIHQAKSCLMCSAVSQVMWKMVERFLHKKKHQQWCSQAVTHSSAHLAQCCLTSSTKVRWFRYWWINPLDSVALKGAVCFSFLSVGPIGWNPALTWIFSSWVC
jgi:hypothetical protein